MISFTDKKGSERYFSKTQTRSKNLGQKQVSASIQSLSNEHYLLQRKATCSCGGGCPSCQSKSSNLKVSHPTDASEIEADRIADKILGKSEQGKYSNGKAKLNTNTSFNKTKIPLKRKVNNFSPISGKTAPTPSVNKVLNSTGESLSEETKSFFEPRLGYDLENVRIHRDANAAESAKTIDALAYTFGNKIVFGENQYAPETDAGKKLLAHELVHTIQQSDGKVSRQIQRTGAGRCARPTETVDEQRDELSRAGRIAHAQIQGYYAAQLSAEVPIPRATRRSRATNCPASGTRIGRADLWKYSGGFSPVKVGEIKSINGRQYAAPDAAHYLKRLRELQSRFFPSDPMCPGPPDNADTDFDSNWLTSSMSSGRALNYQPLDEVIPDSPPANLGPFWGDPLRKTLKCERRAGGAVVYWCVNRDLTEEEEERERQRLRIPVGEEERRTAPQTGTRPTVIIDRHPLFDELTPHFPVRVPAGRFITISVPEPLFMEILGVHQMQQYMRRVQIPYHRHPIHQFRIITWSVLAATLAAGVVASLAVLIGAAAPVAAGGVVAGGGTAAGGGGGAVVIPLFTAVTTENTAKAAAVLIVVGTLASGSEAQAQEAVERAMSNPEIIASVDVTDDPFSLSGGAQMGSHTTINGLPYRVIALLGS